MTTEFTFLKFKWLEAVARDGDMPRSSVALAVLFATRYFNSESGEAWPAMSTLAGDLGITEATVVAAVDKLVDAKYLRRNSGGPRTTNRYSIPERWKPPAAVYSAIRQTYTEQYGSRIADGTSDVYSAIPDTVNETEKRTRERRRRASPPEIRSSSGWKKKRQTTTFPADYGCGPEEIEVAARVANWAADRAKEAFKEFRRWHRDRGTESIDWRASWETWCQNGRKFDEEKSNRSPSRRDRAGRAVRGAKKWIDGQRAAAGGYVPSDGQED